MRPDSDRTERRLPAGRRLSGSLMARLALATTAVVVLATVAAGIGVRHSAYLVIVHGDMMTMEKLPAFLAGTRIYLIAVSVLTAAVAVAVAWLLFRQIIRPLRRIEEVAAAVATGDYSKRLSERGGDELGRLARAIDGMTAALGQVEQQRRELVANVAHELRTPLTAAQGLLSAMRDGLLPAGEANLDAAAEELMRLTRLVEALHQLSLSDAAPRGASAGKPLDLSTLVTDVVAGMQPLLDGRDVSLAVSPGVQVTADRDALVQVLVNLLDNAAKYTPAGGWVRVTVSAAGEVAISNSGPGIPPADLPRIFERFYRGEKSRSRETGGAGIGLAIVKNLIDAHGGLITAESGNGVTTFRFEVVKR